MDTTLSEETLLKIVADIESGEKTPIEIRREYNITSYRYYKIIQEFDVNTKMFKQGPKGPTGPKKTKFKELLQGPVEEKTDLPEAFSKENFIVDSKNGMKIVELMDKYKLTLYQIRELRKNFNLKIK